MLHNPYVDLGLHASELMAIIDDTIFYKETDRDIAINVYVKSMTVSKCASELRFDDCKTVQRRLPIIKDRINHTIKTLK